jgi:hypothetical protein
LGGAPRRAGVGGGGGGGLYFRLGVGGCNYDASTTWSFYEKNWRKEHFLTNVKTFKKNEITIFHLKSGSSNSK